MAVQAIMIPSHGPLKYPRYRTPVWYCSQDDRNIGAQALRTVKRPNGVDPYPHAATTTNPPSGQFRESIPSISLFFVPRIPWSKSSPRGDELPELSLEICRWTRSSGLLPINIIQCTVHPKPKHKTPIHPRGAGANKVWHKNKNCQDVDQNTHKTKQCD